MYIVGFNSNGSPLSPEQMFEDISADYRTKTATIEKLPFLQEFSVICFIHPCKHANVMKILLDKVRVVRQTKKEKAAGRTRAGRCRRLGGFTRRYG
ncbi:CPS_collapsed_G0049160.mRNA.1.CDS.1 [Saccharomyces cerevisiae]|nr:CPS_collapsed_G0049160.mRNA.1.CDS.1 [Saccharomyces cerevisiae]